ncbi:MAG TPA: phosphodiester glycosidase family protein, partial [Gemmatimonadaceae bacterium]|nr:phosphodiester glycosidase family protein [Gemmatimonadaceae bacterium]
MQTTRPVRVAISVVALAACARPATTVSRGSATLHFATGDSVTVDTVAPGITHYRVIQPKGPFRVQVVTVPVDARYELIAARANDSLYGRERVTDMVRRRVAKGERIPVALNADFFDLRGGTGTNENNQVIDGKLWKGNPVTDSPFDTFRNSHIQFAVGENGKPYIDRFTYVGTIEGTCGKLTLDGVNSLPRVPNALILFTSAYGSGPRRDSVHAPRELAVRTNAPAGGIGAIELTRNGALPDPAGPVSGPNGVLAAYGTAGARLDSVAGCGPTLRVTHAFRPDRGRLTMIVGGWPRVVQDGRNIGAIADSLEGTFPRFSAQQHPRSAIGFSRDSSTVYLVAVDGRQESADGMSLAELGEFLISIGVYQ